MLLIQLQALATKPVAEGIHRARSRLILKLLNYVGNMSLYKADYGRRTAAPPRSEYVILLLDTATG